MIDLKLEGKNNHKKGVRASASAEFNTSADLDNLLFTLPVASLVTGIFVITTTPSGVADSTVDVTISGDVVADEAKVDSVGVSTGTVTQKYFETGGDIKVVAGSTAPDDAGVIKVVVEYIETDLSIGEYTA